MQFLLFHQGERQSSGQIFIPRFALRLEDDEASHRVRVEPSSVLDEEVASVSTRRSA